jgi:hypothetical protein
LGHGSKHTTAVCRHFRLASCRIRCVLMMILTFGFLLYKPPHPRFVFIRSIRAHLYNYSSSSQTTDIIVRCHLYIVTVSYTRNVCLSSYAPALRFQITLDEASTSVSSLSTGTLQWPSHISLRVRTIASSVIEVKCFASYFHGMHASFPQSLICKPSRVLYYAW